jgi:hypothetical protein
MKNNFKKIFFSFIFLSVFFSGCSTSLFNSSYSKVECLNKIENKYSDLCYKYQDNYKCAIGVGNSDEEALKDAKRKLAESVFTVVESSFSEKIKKELRGKASSIKTGKIEWSSLNLTYLELEDINILKKGKDGNCYYAVILWDKKKAEKAVEDFRKKADAIMYVNLIEKVKDINLKLKLLVKLDNLVSFKHLDDNTVTVNGTTTTFRSYIDSTLNELVNKLTVAFTGEKFYLITKDKFLPIEDLKLTLKDVNGKTSTFISGEDGSVYVPSTFILPINVYLTLHNKDFLIGTLAKKDKSIIYISTKPEKISYELYKNGKAISTGITPNKVEVYPASYDRYKIVLPATKEFSRVEENLNVKRGFDAYFFREMEKVRYGKVDLKVDDAILDIESVDGRKIVQGVEKFRGKIAVGTYKITVKKKDDSQDYQIVNDKLVVNEKDIIKREYFEPKDRDFYREGWGYYLGFSSLLPSKLTKNGKTYQDDEFNQDDYEVTLFLLGLKKYYTHFFFGGDLGLAVESSNNSSSSDTSGMGYYLSANVGAYMPFDGIKGDIEISAGYAYMSYSYDDNYNKKNSYDTEYTGAFVGVKITFLNMLGLEVRKYQDQTKMVFSIGFNSFKTGYKYPRYIDAVKGRDYE